MKNNLINIDKINELVRPIVEGLNYELYYIEYVREQNENYLRIYIDSSKGINLEDCQKVSRKVSDMLDEKDPIEDGYYLEVSSPGIERVLHTDEHLHKYINNQIVIKLAKLFEGSREHQGKLLSFNDESVTIEKDNENISIPRDRIKKIILKGEF
ncbi:ribosome maturation factor RimP [Clostridium botulinum]|uniref:Ribosome maturation factor RimP n=1 Tax=Clostridium botulinum C/D str. DC5 TaxID=1443128 RepID=A0A0A0IDS3_CLOBO|nr:ribosome maturation factor RimP [Clostridium botulinum]KEI01413.1 ribosome maturation protein RimP [Clostridium botulinum C/D str. BKT75002]KEI07747.1 ribosome maturation protein RimP [Clostridium botulinum C/D str. BKT2873]KGM94192.1 ribosome maturation protein RimP [Clostridium botulinum D str. CCUG 7971]KGM99107.1 ribosome maturation protein RimP [Clostridium botulinum C/D str. DC5]KOC45869.1 ribosome maturation protein RimP [Clostridium botulinum]